MTSEKKQIKKRFEPLDYLRGFIIGSIVITEQAGSSYSWPFLNHSNWIGFTFTDWLFPCLIVCMGFAMVFSLKKPTKIDGRFVKKVLVRGLLLIAIGIALNFFDGFFSRLYDGMGGSAFIDALHNLRFYGILQRIGFVYIVGAFIIMLAKKDAKTILIIGLSTLVLYLFILGFGHGYEYSTKNIIYIVDNAIIPQNHLYVRTINDVTLTLDPEGLVSMISTIGQLLLAYGIGKLFIESKDKDAKKASLSLLVYSIIFIVVGVVLVMTISPVIKRAWTTSFVCITTGISFIVISLLALVTIKKPYQNVFFVFKVLGVSALGIFVMSNVLTYIVKYIPFADKFIKYYINDSLCTVCFGNVYLASFCCAFLLLSFIWFIGWLLYRNDIIIKL